MTLTDADGNPYTIEDENVALCRCGGIANEAVLRRLPSDQRFYRRRSAPFLTRLPSTMPSYVRAGSLPHKRHIQFRRPDGGLYAEELFSTKGFESVYSLLYHLRPPTATLDVRRWERPPVRFVENDPLRNRHFKTNAVAPSGLDAIESRVPLLGNADIVVSIAQADRPMDYFYRNTGGDELLFVHRGSGVLETPVRRSRLSRARLRHRPDRHDLPPRPARADAHARPRIAPAP